MYSVRRFVGILSITAVASLVTASPALPQVMEPITLVGYWDRTPGDDPEISGEVSLAAGGAPGRTFGYIVIQSRLGTSSRDVFRRSLRPVVTLRGQRATLDRLNAATSRQKASIIGMFDVRSNAITLNSVEVADAPANVPDGAPAN